MSFSHGHQLVQRQSLVQRLTLGQRFTLQTQILQLRSQLLEALRKEKYTPVAKCPACGMELNHLQIMQGFNRDVNDLTTGCPKCQTRFCPRLIFKGIAVSVELPFYCPVQTLDRIVQYWRLTPDELCKRNQALYRSAVAHFGTLKAALAKIGINYQFDEVTEWKDKVSSFLGKMPDTTIASYCGARVSEVRKLRKELGVMPYSSRRLLAEIE